MTIAQIIEDIAPELASVDTDRRDRIIALAENQVSAKVFGDLYETAVAYLAAHMLTVAGRQGNAGAIGSISEGQLSIGYQAGQNVSGLMATSYGQEFARLRRQRVVGPRTRMVDCG